MGVNQLILEQQSNNASDLDLQTDIVVIGGGSAGAWAALSAASSGAKVVLVDKGYCGASGSTAAAGTTVWFEPSGEQRAREAAAMLATARWMYSSGIQRQETRGMHKREDFPLLDPNQQCRLISGGLDTIWVKPEQTSVSRELVSV